MQNNSDFLSFERDDLFGTESETIIKFFGIFGKNFLSILKAPSYCIIRYKLKIVKVQLMCIQISLGDI